MRIAICTILALGAVFMSSCGTTTNAKSHDEEVLLHTHSGYYKMSPAPVLYSDLARIRIEHVEKVKGPKDTICTQITYKTKFKLQEREWINRR